MNYDLGKTEIAKGVRVSSAAIWYDLFGGYFQYETWIFSDNVNQPSRQSIHGTAYYKSYRLEEKTKKIHEYISNNLKQRLNQNKS